MKEIERRRLRWRARRGLLENDLLITRFLDRHERELDEAQAAALAKLLDLPDNELLGLLLGRAELPLDLNTRDVQGVLIHLRAA